MKPGRRLKRMNIHIDSKLHDAFKATTAAQGKKMTDVLLRYIEDYVRKHQTAGAVPKGDRG
jgi:ParG